MALICTGACRFPAVHTAEELPVLYSVPGFRDLRAVPVVFEEHPKAVPGKPEVPSADRKAAETSEALTTPVEGPQDAPLLHLRRVRPDDPRSEGQGIHRSPLPQVRRDRAEADLIFILRYNKPSRFSERDCFVSRCQSSDMIRYVVFLSRRYRKRSSRLSSRPVSPPWCRAGRRLRAGRLPRLPVPLCRTSCRTAGCL